MDYSLKDSAGYWLGRLWNSARRSFEEEISGYGVSLSQWFVLSALHNGDADSVGALAAFIGTDKSAVSRSAHRLVLSGYVERLPGDDRRSSRLRLTRRGKRLTEDLAQVLEDAEHHYFETLHDSDYHALRVVLAHLLEENDGVAPVGWLSETE